MAGYQEMKDDTDDYRKMRRIAFVGIVVSTVATMTAVLTVPLVYSYVQNLQSHVLDEVDFCKARTRQLWAEMLSLQSEKGVSGNYRQRREWLFGQWVNAATGLAEPLLAGTASAGGAKPKGDPYGPVALPTVAIQSACKESLL